MMRQKIKTNIVLFFIFLIISIPFAVADSSAQINKGLEQITGRDIEENSDGTMTVSQGFGLDLGFVSDSISVPSPSQACTQKSSDIDSFLSWMDGDIGTLADIIQIIYTVSTVITSVHEIVTLLTTYWPGCLGGSLTTGCSCKLPAWGNVVCAFLYVLYQITGAIKTAVDFFAIPLMCKSESGGWPMYSWCTSSQVGSAFGGPFSNIYMALACLCPTAILFNLRKLKVIYQTFNCCVQSSCNKGVSTTGCYTYLDQATCTFWEGSIINMLWSLIWNLVLKKVIEAIFNYILKMISKRLSTTLAVAIYETAAFYFMITGLQEALETLEKTFSDPDCSSMLADIGLNYTSSTSNVNTLIDDRGIYTSTS